MTSARRLRPYVILQIAIPFVIFLALAGGNIREFFGGDDLMNLYQYAEKPLSHWFMGLLHFWSSDWYRPLGGVVYLLLFHTFGLHPLPFKIVLFAVLLGNMALYLKVTRTLTGSLSIAVWALLLCSYHAAMNGLYLNFGTIYDVLGFTFFFGALAVYAGWVTTGRRPVAGFLLVMALYIGGLCCKEVVVSLPAVLFFYSALLTRTMQTERWRWLYRSGLSVSAGAVIAGVYTLGKMRGPGSFADQPLYKPHFTLHQFALTTAHYMRELFYLRPQVPTLTASLWILALMAVAALLLQSRTMLFSVISIVLTQLPVSFIAPRGAFAIYITVGFWALFLAALVHAVLPLRRHPAAAFAGYALAAALLVIVHARMKVRYDSYYVPQTRAYQSFAEHLALWNVQLPPAGRVLMLNDPFPENWIGYDSLFLVSLYARTNQAAVYRMKTSPAIATLGEINSYDYVVDYDTDWRLLKAPKGVFSGQRRLEEFVSHAPVLLLDGFDPPSPDGWRPVRQTFALRVRPDAGAHVLSVSLGVFEPMKISAQVDGGAPIEKTATGQGNVNFAVPVDCSAAGEAHDVRFHATTSRLIFLSEQLH